MSTRDPSSSCLPRPWLRWTWEATDGHVVVTVIGVGLLLTAVGMALFGLPPVDLHGVLHHFGIMDPLCGGTRAARYAAAGQWGEAWRYNPLGIVVVLAAVAISLRAVAGLLTARWLTVTVCWTPRRKAAVIAVLVSLTVALAVRQQLSAELLIAGT